MSPRRYEISDEQWEQIKDMFPRAKTGRPPKDNRMMFNAAEQHGRIFRKDTDRIKACTADSVNGVMTVHWRISFMS